MARGIGTFFLILLAGVVGLWFGGAVLGGDGTLWAGLLFPIATAGGLITYYQASAEKTASGTGDPQETPEDGSPS